MKAFTLAMAAALALAAAGAQAAEPLAKTLFGAAKTGSAQMPSPMGSYAKGCLAGGLRMPEDGPGWQFVRLSRNRNWGHPEAFSFLTRLAAAGQAAGGNSLLVGDVSQPRGGPMTTGHASHQIGLDLDIWFNDGPAAPMSRAARESAGAVSMVAADKRRVTAAFGPLQRALLRASAEDGAVARIFVNAAIKAELCRTEPEPRPWLRKLRPWWGHDAHFHVRLACPAGAELCRDQDPPATGDGCDASLDWWFSDEALNPPPPKTPPVRARDVMTLADLPAECRGVLDAD
ncbi:MAG: penicillin-insensitive murein endopeptidase [Pseudomonadota bacterium]|nr:penicillin-insensitive murein endopeptidase [Pseudomonadota bacterium]